MPRILLVSCFLLALGACGNAAPQNEQTRALQSLSLSKVTTSSADARQEFTDGVNEEDWLRYEEAYEHFKRAAAADPNFALAELYASRAAFQAGSSQEVLAHLARAVALSPKASEVERLEIQADKALSDHNTDDAIKIAQQLTKTDASGPRSWLELSNVYTAANMEPDARTALAKGIEVAPQMAVLYCYLSQSDVQIEPHDFVKGEQLARKCVELAPNEASAHDALGDALRAQGKLPEAAAEYTKQAELDPTRGDGYQQRGHVNTFLGKYKEARADYDAAVAASTGNRKFGLGMYRAFVHLYEGDPKAADDELANLTKSVDGANLAGATDIKLIILTQELTISFHHRMIPQLQQATEQWNSLRKQQAEQANAPDFTRQANADIALNDGFLALAKGDFAKAKAQAAEVMRIREPEHSASKYQSAHALLGALAVEQKRYADAIAELNQANPNDRYGWYLLARAHEALGQSADAKKYYSLIAHSYFNAVEIALLRNEALAKLGEGKVS